MVGIVGHMSGGKSYTAVRFILAWLSKSHIVCTNIRLVADAVTSYIGSDRWIDNYYYINDYPDSEYKTVKPTDYASFPVGSPRGSADYNDRIVYIVLDEASSIFDSMTSARDAGIQDVAVWARHSEKRGQMIYLIMQFPNELHKRLRIHIQEYLNCRNTNTIKFPVLNIGVPFFLRNLISVTPYLNDGETQMGRPILWRLDPMIYQCYRTAQIVVGSSDFAPSSVTQIDTFRMPRMGFYLLSVIALVVTLGWIAYEIIKG